MIKGLLTNATDYMRLYRNIVQAKDIVKHIIFPIHSQTIADRNSFKHESQEMPTK